MPLLQLTNRAFTISILLRSKFSIQYTMVILLAYFTERLNMTYIKALTKGQEDSRQSAK